MKKLFTLTMTMILMLVLSVSAFAQSNESTELVDTQVVPSVESQNMQPIIDLTDITSDADIVPFGTWNINWTMKANSISYAPSSFTMSKGSTISFSLKWSPQPDTVAVGLYNRDENKFYPLKNSSSSPFSGTVAAPKAGLYSFAVYNTSTISSIQVTGLYTY